MQFISLSYIFRNILAMFNSLKLWISSTGNWYVIEKPREHLKLLCNNRTQHLQRKWQRRKKRLHYNLRWVTFQKVCSESNALQVQKSIIFLLTLVFISQVLLHLTHFSKKKLKLNHIMTFSEPSSGCGRYGGISFRQAIKF